MLEPVLKYAGGKRRLVPLLRALYAPHRHRRLVEPFVGGLSVALGLNPDRALLGDSNPHVINLYRHLRRGLLIDRKFVHEKSFYYACRDEFNELVRSGASDCQRAAELFLYLNRSGYNGLLRLNSRGEFNVPFGKYDVVEYRTDFSEYVSVLARWEFVCCDFAALAVEDDDAVYLDPPYDVEFTSYTRDKFDWEDQVRLAEMFAAHPGPVVASNQATPRILDLYRQHGYEVFEISMARSISSSGDRTPAREMLAVRNIDIGVDAVRNSGLNMSAYSISSACAYSNVVAVAVAVAVSRAFTNATENLIEGEAQMAELPDDMAEEVGKSRTAGGGNWIQHGNYVLMILDWFYQKIQHRCIITKFLVIEAQKKVVYEGADKTEEEPNDVGSECQITVDFDGEGKLSAPSNSRAPVLGLFGFKENEVQDAVVKDTLKQVTSDRRPAYGMLIRLETFPKKIQKPKPGGRQYLTGLNWECVDRPGGGLNSAEAVRARVEAYGRAPMEGVAAAAAQLAQSRGTAAPANGNGNGHAQPAFAPQAQLPSAPQAVSQMPAQAGFSPPQTQGFAQAPGFAAPQQMGFAQPQPQPQTQAQPQPQPPPQAVIPAARFPGWTQHQQNPLYYYRQKPTWVAGMPAAEQYEFKLESDLAAGR